DDSHMSVSLSVGAGTSVGTVNMSVGNNGATSNSVPFQILDFPAITSVSPSVGYRGGQMVLTLRGQNLTADAASINFDNANGITVAGKSASADNTVLTISLTLSPSATPGSRIATITIGNVTVNHEFTIDAAPAAPGLTAITP